jgi:ABC-2 type transport system permease protein
MYFLIKFLIRKWRERQAAGANEPADDDPMSSLEAPDAARFRRAAGHQQPRTRVRSGASNRPLGLLAHQARYDLLASLRNPRARFFTFMFPILLLVVFNGVFGGGHTIVNGVRVKLSVFYVPGILTMSIVVASFASLVISVTSLRESGVLKRRRATPAPAGLLIGGQALATLAVTSVMSVLVLVIAKLFYGVGLAPGAIASVAITVIVGTIAFSCIGYAVSGLIGSADAAQPITQATLFPLWFLSGVFIPIHNLSTSLKHVGELFPIEHLSNLLHLASVHGSFSSAFSISDVLVLAAWGVAAGAFAAWRFSWLPSAATA